MGDVLDREFFIEQFRRMHDEFRRVHDRLDQIDMRVRRLTDEFQVLRERSDTQHREISNFYATLIELDRRADRVERRLDLDQTEH